ncbi:LysR family regulatory protein [Staphylococcus aureus]|nr:LysR family regulatory protein [Staphylococcus aureus]
MANIDCPQHLADLAKNYPELYIHVYLNNSDTVLQHIKNKHYRFRYNRKRGSK